MKRTAVILCLVTILSMMSAVFVFADADNSGDADSGNEAAGTLKIIEQHPEDKSKTTPPTNVGIKLFFNEDFSNKDLQKKNKKLFSLTDPKGKEVPIQVLFSTKEPNYILIVANPKNDQKTLSVAKDYTLTIDKSLQADNGSTFGGDYKLTFRTRDTSNDTTVNMVLMGLMFVGIIIFTTLQARREVKKDVKKREDKVDVYKVAREKGKSVEEVVNEMEKKKQRQERKDARKNKDGKDSKGDEPDEGIFKVKERRPIAAAGGIYKPKKAKPEVKTAKKASAKKGSHQSKKKKGKKKKK